MRLVAASLGDPALALLVVLAALVFGFGLGEGGFVNTEGHRVIPAWEMVDSGEYLVPRLFGQIYVRKPPGHFWALAGSAAVFGKTEFAARLVGGLAGLGMVVTAYLFARRWFGASAGFAAGMAQLLFPLLWKFERSAEIEGLHNWAAQLSALVLIHVLLLPPTSRRGGWLQALVLGMTLFGAILTKGPASIPCHVGILLSAALLRETAGLKSRCVWGGIGLAGLSSALLFGAIWWRVTQLHEPIVAEEVDKFLWQWSTVGGAVTLLPSTLLHTLPNSLLVLVPWWAWIHTGTRGRVERMVGLGAVMGVLVYSVLGVSNARYAMPALTYVSVLTASALPVWRAAVQRGVRWGRLGAIPSPAMAVVLLFCLWVGWVGWLEPKQRRTSGRAEGERMAALLPEQGVLWGDSLIEARPETLLYAEREAKRLGKRIEVRWHKHLSPDEKGLVALRRDDGELATFAGMLSTPEELILVHEGKVYKFPYVLARVGVSASASANNDPRALRR